MLPRCRGPLLPVLAVCLLSPLRARADFPFSPPVRPALPRVQDTAWARNPLDVFALAKPEEARPKPNPPARRIPPLRRVTFGLTGLAPPPEERAAFLADNSPDAYEKVVDRLLASPHFGERWASHWLDVVRFAETEGYKFDSMRP